MTLTFRVCHVKISENGGSFRGMRVFDKDHNFIGTVTRRELKLLSRENNGIMPVTVSMTPVEDRQIPKGNQVIAVGSLAGAFAALLHFLFRLIPVPEYMAVWNILFPGKFSLFVWALLIRFIGCVIMVPYKRRYLFHTIVSGSVPLLLFAPSKLGPVFAALCFFVLFGLMLRITEERELFYQPVLMLIINLIYLLNNVNLMSVYVLMFLGFAVEFYVFFFAPQGVKKKDARKEDGHEDI